MRLFSIVELTVSILFLIMGYKIYFKKKYSLINGYNSQKHCKEYPKSVGKIQLITALVWLIVSIISYILTDEYFAIVFTLFFIPIVFNCISLIYVSKKYNIT